MYKKGMVTKTFLKNKMTRLKIKMRKLRRTMMTKTTNRHQMRLKIKMPMKTWMTDRMKTMETTKVKMMRLMTKKGTTMNKMMKK